MFDFTRIARPFFALRSRRVNASYANIEAIQRRQLAYLISKGRKTLFGERFLIGISDYEDFASHVPMQPYDHLRSLIMRMVNGDANILWPGRVTRFAQSSGTSDGKSKYIPVTNDSLTANHYRGSADVVASYLNLYPDSRLFSGKALILGGSFANELRLKRGVKVGDLSAHLIDRINPVVNLFRVPSKEIALTPDWNEKLPNLIEASLNQDITNISGVPSWFLTVLKGVIQRAGANSIHDVWPNLEVFFHGGIAFAPYREQYAHITDPAKMRYIETYNSSEGFFAVQHTFNPGAMRLIIDAGVFYEFVPLDQIDNPFPDALPAWAVEPGKVYAMMITSCNGLWRYPIGDTVRIESLNPLAISIAGRTKSFINAFGEEVMVYNTDRALEHACAATGAEAVNYTAAPVYAGDRSRGRHQWLIEFAKPPKDIDKFAEILDKALQNENSDYQAKRYNSIFLDPIEVIVARKGVFDRWLALSGKLGGQRKVPRLANDRHILDSILPLNNQIQ